MIVNYTMAPDRLAHDMYRADSAVKPWNSVEAEKKSAKKIQTYDPQEEIDRCDTCPLPACNGSSVCWYRLGLEKPRSKGQCAAPEQRPPKGYDEEKLTKAMVHAYNQKDLAKALGLSLYAARKWLAWRERE